MKKIVFLTTALLLVLAAQSQTYPWKNTEIMETADLAMKINKHSKDLPKILNVGPEDNIKSAIKIGAVNSPEGINKLKVAVAKTSKSKAIVLYCGCCTYANCPNIKPAFETLKKSGYTVVKVLNIPEGLTPDWAMKGYPMEK